jgi:hypothetical protein
VGIAFSVGVSEGVWLGAGVLETPSKPGCDAVDTASGESIIASDSTGGAQEDTINKQNNNNK